MAFYCISRLGQTCSHIAALLYRVEAAVRVGLTNQTACTSLPCKWTIPSRKTPVEPPMVSNMDWKVTKHGQLGEKPNSSGYGYKFYGF